MVQNVYKNGRNGYKKRGLSITDRPLKCLIIKK